ncbi:GGDEF domain-containing response regulator [Thermodesulfatator autotrophicus]|uniref:diguanylate cyclase n=1 Tax=Thermodesulfatator autotrophicus TaxID=1795632 RepID=A0A177E9Z6_9BACT|nr:diguanylate cyclase [Thermodesulfatator autotrophicus]OAG28757.1 hypothetical protein TH606_00395 [Thermodesulfatator autotrophicus]
MEKENFCLERPAKTRFLVVEDDPLTRKLIASFLAHHDCPCDTAPDGQKALDLIKEGQNYTLIITDIFMPNMDGLTLIKKVKEINPAIDIIAITAYGQKIKYKDVIEAGASDFIRKPFELDELEAKIKRILRERELRAKLELLTRQDPLTGIFNRRYFEEKLEEECYKAWRQKYPLHLTMFDVDMFKQFNDTFGHQAGDHLLKKLANIIVSSTRRYVDLPFRYGGDEFVLILPQCNTEAACKVIRRIINRFKQEDVAPASLSAGIARFIHTEGKKIQESIDDLIFRADEALYEAKRKGGNILVVDPLTSNFSS